MDVVLLQTGVRLGELRNPKKIGPQDRVKVPVLFLHHCNMMGDLGRVDLSQIGFRPNLIIVCSDPQGGDAIQELVQGRLLSMTREVIVGAAAEQAVIRKPPSWRVWPIARAPSAIVSSLKTGRDILPCGNGTAELSMKAPMSVSKPTDLG